MEERLLLFVTGIFLIVLNAVLARGFMWWEKTVIQLSDELNPWIYRFFCIALGFLFISISILKS